MESPREIRWINIDLDRDYTGRPRRFRFHPDIPLPAPQARRLASNLLASTGHAVPASPALLWLMEAVQREWRRRDTDWQALLRNLTAAMLLEFGRCLTQPLDDRHGPVHARVAAFLQELREQAAEAWTLSSMAAACALSRSRFSDYCHQIAGESPLNLLRRYRLEQAQGLLRNSERSITDIALSCGFGTSQYFARVFKQAYGRSPRHYRRER